MNGPFFRPETVKRRFFYPADASPSFGCESEQPKKIKNTSWAGIGQRPKYRSEGRRSIRRFIHRLPSQDVPYYPVLSLVADQIRSRL